MGVVVVIIFAVLPLIVDSQILPAVSKPTEYFLKLNVSDFLTATTFNGTVEIKITVISPTPQLLLHAHNLNITGVRVMRKSSFSGWVEEPVSDFSVYDSLCRINFSQPVPTTSYKVFVDYKGHFQDTMAGGFTKVGYHFNRTPKFLGVTKLEPTYARSVFPCYDERGHRTSFILDITVNKSLMVLTNVAPTYVNDTDTLRTFHFDSYPAMPVSQLSWMVFDPTTYVTGVNNSTDTVIRTRAPYPYSNHTAWPAQVTAHLVAALGKYTQQHYFHKDLEQVVIPEFFSGSVEAWGLSSYSEETLLVTPGTTSTRDTQRVALGLSGGLAQHWFGGLVSMNSWEHQWLMRGLAEYLKYTIAASLPEMSSWELREQMVVQTVQLALALDTSQQHALAFDTHGDPRKIESIYDDLTKYKGGAVIRMLHDMLGDLFNKALVVYLQTSAGSTSEPKELWNIMYEAARESHVDLGRQSVEGIMVTWVNISGYPVLDVTWNTTHYNISQPQASGWFVPVSYILQDNTDVIKTMLPPGGSVTIPGTKRRWIVVNINQTGYYRVNYQEQLLDMLCIQLAAEPNKVPLLSRAQIIDDIFYLMYNGSLSPEFPLKFSSNCLKAVSDYYSWFSVLRNYEDLLHRLNGHSAHQMLKEHLLDLMEGVVAKLGLTSQPQDSHIDKLMRVMVLEKACAYGHPACVQKAVSLLHSWIATTHYDVDLSAALLCPAVANSSSEMWRSIWDMYHYSVFPSVKVNILRALTCSRDVLLMNQFLTNITSTSAPVVNTKDKTILLQTLASTPFGAELLLDWLIQTLHAQMNSSGSTTSTVNQTEDSSHMEKQSNVSSKDAPADQQTPPREHRAAAMRSNISEDDVKAILSYIAPKLTTLEQGAKIDGFAAKNNTGLSGSAVELMRNVTRQIYLQADWANKHNGPIAIWLQKEASATTPEAPTEKPTSQPPTSVPAPPSSAPQSHSGLTLSVGLLVFVLHYIATS